MKATNKTNEYYNYFFLLERLRTMFFCAIMINGD